MADIGTISAHSPRVLNHDTTCVSGTVEELGAPVPRRCVRLYLRSSGAMLSQTYSRPDGSFILPTQRTVEGRATYVVALTEETFNALIFDKLIPT